MLKRFDYFLPNLKESWVIVLLLVVGGNILGSIPQVALMLTKNVDLKSFVVFISYILMFIPPFVGILLFANKVITNNTLYSQNQMLDRVINPVKFDNGYFGGNAIIILILITIATLTSIIVIEPLSSWIPMPDSFKEMFKNMISKDIWSFLSVVIAAPILEELVCRGTIARGLFKHTTVTKAILWSAFIFAVIHFNPWQGITAFILGAFLAWIYWRTHSLLTCMYIHALNNGTAFMLTILFPELDELETAKEFFEALYPGSYNYIYIISAIILVLSIVLLNKIMPKQTKETFLGNSNAKQNEINLGY